MHDRVRGLQRFAQNRLPLSLVCGKAGCQACDNRLNCAAHGQLAGFGTGARTTHSIRNCRNDRPAALDQQFMDGAGIFIRTTLSSGVAALRVLDGERWMLSHTHFVLRLIIAGLIIASALVASTQIRLMAI